MRNRVTLRQAMAADASAIRHLTRSAYAKWIGVVGREPKPMIADYAAAVMLHRIDLLYVNDALAALIETLHEARCLLVENVAVSPAFQGRGLGRRLMAHAETLAAELGCAGIRLYTNQRFTENIAIYRHLGYQVDREEDVGVGVAVHMSKRIYG